MAIIHHGQLKVLALSTFKGKASALTDIATPYSHRNMKNWLREHRVSNLLCIHAI